MKCKFEHEGDCFNCGSSQYMYRCKPEVCQSAVPMTNADRIRAMSDEELVDVLCGFATKPMQGSFLKWLQQPAEEADHA